MTKNQFTMRAEVWLYPGMSGWHFVTLPKRQSATIKKTFGVLARGFGSLPVVVTIGKTSWKSSIFPTSAKATAGKPDKNAGAYLLPLKADVRKKEKISNGDTITFLVEIKI